jgi:hypothetical protein
MEIANMSSECEIVRLPPPDIRVSPLDSPAAVMSDHWNTRPTQDFWASGRIANHEYLPVCSSMTRIDGAFVFKSKVHDHIFKSSTDVEEHKIMQVVQPDEAVLIRPRGPMIWIFAGFVV